MAIPNPNPNIADGIKCDNKTYSSNKIESLIKTATELPIPEEGDAGKVLAVDNELGYELAAPVDPSVLIDDSASAETTTYSSDKIDTLLSGKADTPIVTAYTDFSFGTGIDSASSSVTITKIGKLVFVRGYLKIGENALADGDALLTGIPSRTGARNDNTFPLEISNNSQLSSATSMQACWIDASANLCIAGAGNASNYILINFNYISA